MTGGAGKERADVLLARHGLVESRARAAQEIRAGTVFAGDAPVTKPGMMLAADAPLRLDKPAIPYVSRAGLKLAAALDHFALDPAGRRALDVGASTGGFTQVLLERGAQHVTAVDVGHGQLHARLAAEPRVTSLEGQDIRTLSTGAPAGPVTAITCDVSFISLSLVLPAMLGHGVPGAWAVLLIKPQFEVGREAVGKGGVVKDAAARRTVCERIIEEVRALGWSIEGTMESPIAGADGNQEICLAAHKTA